jgi:hypothetical protein
VRKDNYVQINKNLMNYPLARDPHVRAKWTYSKKRKLWWCEVPGQPKLRLRLSKDTPEAARRLPSGFDMNVLFLCVMVAHLRKSDSVTFASRTEVLKRLEVSVSTANMRKLDAALELWTALKIRHLKWYLNKGEYASRVLPPPITSLVRKGDAILITLHDDWLHLQKGYLTKVPMPLPPNSAEQNMILKAAAWRVKGKNLRGRRREWSVKKLGQEIGLFHRMAYSVLRKRVIPFVKDWFLARGDIFMPGWDKGGRKIRFRGVAKYKWLGTLSHDDPYADA